MDIFVEKGKKAKENPFMMAILFLFFTPPPRPETSVV